MKSQKIYRYHVVSFLEHLLFIADNSWKNKSNLNNRETNMSISAVLSYLNYILKIVENIGFDNVIVTYNDGECFENKSIDNGEISEKWIITNADKKGLIEHPYKITIYSLNNQSFTERELSINLITPHGDIPVSTFKVRRYNLDV